LKFNADEFILNVRMKIILNIICDTLSAKVSDSLWLEECLNDMYSGGLKDDKFNLLYSANQLVNIAVRTPVG
jgi:hypothetical protein